MEKQPRLTCIEISYEDSTNESFNEIRKRKDFINSLANRPLSSIDHIHFGYELHLKLENDGSPNKWKVLKDGEFFFSFKCYNEKDFISLFENKLKKELCERNSPLENDAKVSIL